MLVQESDTEVCKPRGVGKFSMHEICMCISHDNMHNYTCTFVLYMGCHLVVFILFRSKPDSETISPQEPESEANMSQEGIGDDEQLLVRILRLLHA